VPLAVNDSEPVERVTHTARHRTELVNVTARTLRRERASRLPKNIGCNRVRNRRQHPDHPIGALHTKITAQHPRRDRSKRASTPETRRIDISGHTGNQTRVCLRIGQHRADTDPPRRILKARPGKAPKQRFRTDMTFHRSQTRITQLRPGPPSHLRRKPRLQEIKLTGNLLDQHRGLEQLRVRQRRERGNRRRVRMPRTGEAIETARTTQITRALHVRSHAQTMRGPREGAPRLDQVMHRLRHDTSEPGTTDIR
jgi:hypothetical protein